MIKKKIPINFIVIRWLEGESHIKKGINLIIKEIEKYFIFNIVDFILLTHDIDKFYKDNKRSIYIISKMIFYSMLYQIEEIFNKYLCNYGYYIKLGSKNLNYLR